jgi:hypothetical protein
MNGIPRFIFPKNKAEKKRIWDMSFRHFPCCGGYHDYCGHCRGMVAA